MFRTIVIGVGLAVAAGLYFLVARTRLEDDDFNGYFQAMENRIAVAGQDGFRRRVPTNTIRLRNVGSRIEGLPPGRCDYYTLPQVPNALTDP